MFGPTPYTLGEAPPVWKPVTNLLVNDLSEVVEKLDWYPLRLAFCWTHGRRRLIKATPKSRSPIVDEAMVRIAALYKIVSATNTPPFLLRSRPREQLLHR